MSNRRRKTKDNITLEMIVEELAKVKSLKYFDIVASQHQCQVFDRRKGYPESFLVDADYDDNLIGNLIDALFSLGRHETLYEYLKTKL